jgi:hypothetical protein
MGGWGHQSYLAASPIGMKVSKGSMKSLSSGRSQDVESRRPGGTHELKAATELSDIEPPVFAVIIFHCSSQQFLSFNKNEYDSRTSESDYSREL